MRSAMACHVGLWSSVVFSSELVGVADRTGMTFALISFEIPGHHTDRLDALVTCVNAFQYFLSHVNCDHHALIGHCLLTSVYLRWG